MDPLSSYFTLVSKQKPLSREEEQSLFATLEDPEAPRWKKDAARDKIVRSCIMFVAKQAKLRARKLGAYEFEELVAAGNEGLCIALSRFDYKRGHKFLTYAGWWVNQCQWRTQQKLRLVKLPVWQQQLAVKIRDILAKEPRITDVELQQRCAPSTSTEIIANLRKTLYVTVYIDDILRGILSSHSSRHSSADIDDAVARSDITLAPLTVADFSDDLIQSMDDDLLCGRLQAMLSSREWRVVSAMFELAGAAKQSISQLSQDMGCTVSEVRRLQTAAMRKIRQFYVKKGLPEEAVVESTHNIEV